MVHLRDSARFDLGLGQVAEDMQFGFAVSGGRVEAQRYAAEYERLAFMLHQHGLLIDLARFRFAHISSFAP